MNPLDLILQKGGAGISMSRVDTAERLNPILEAHLRLNHAYEYALAHAGDAALAGTLGDLQRTARMDAGKIAETIFSLGGLPFSGTSIEPGSLPVDGHGEAMFTHLVDREKDFGKLVAGEDKLDHQIRTKAILGVLKANSEKRIDEVQKAVRRVRF